MSPYSSPIRIAINGFGRIGRYTAKLLLRDSRFDLVAINDLADPAAMAHLLKYDSIHGKFDSEITLEDSFLRVDEKKIIFTGDVSKHLEAGAKKVILSAPSQDHAIPMIVMGVNDHLITGNEKIISNASCTTNCLAPMVKVLEEHFGIERGFASTIHSYTNDQNLHDAPHRDLRRARAAAYSIIPTTTNAGKALDRVIPALAGKIEASAMRVPVPDGSLTDLVVTLSREVTTNEVNQAFKRAAASDLKGYLQVESDPIVSMDIIGNPHSCILDEALSSAKGNLVKVVAWYDNESGYANRLMDLLIKINLTEAKK